MDSIDYAKSYKPAGSPVHIIEDQILTDNGVQLLIKRDDLLHKHISGNKWRKLKYNLSEAVQQNHHTILTFGGAYSNHLAATAFACNKVGVESIGIVRGEDDAQNPTLNFLRSNNMRLKFVSRTDYRRKREDGFIEDLMSEFGNCFMIPEGGANGLGVRGCAEILPEVEESFEIVCCAAGTGTTLAGLALSLQENQKLIGFPALKGGGFLEQEMLRLIDESRLKPLADFRFELNTDYHFGGYAKMKPELFNFIQGFQGRNNIPLDPVYTSKMMFGVYDLIQKGHFSRGTSILAIHTGGLQGWDGMIHRGLV